MIRLRNPLGVYSPAKRPSSAPFKQDNRRMMREKWAEFCTEHCPHPGKDCTRGTCKEFKALFGRRKDA